MAYDTALPSAIIGVLIVVENIIVCYIVYRFPSLRTWTNGFITSLAVSDILFGVIIVPFHIIDEKHPANGYLIAMVLLVNITNLLSTTFDRYLAVLKPFLYVTFMGKSFRRIVIMAWIIPIAISLLPLVWKADPMTTIHTVYLFFVLILGILIPYVLIILAYIRIFREVIKQVQKVAKLFGARDRHTLRKRRDAAINEGKRLASEAKVAKVFAVITAIFVVGWMPLVYMTIVGALHKMELIPSSLPVIAWYTLCFSTLINAPIYAYFKSDFRSSFKKLFACRKGERLLHSLDKENGEPSAIKTTLHTVN